MSKSSEEGAGNGAAGQDSAGGQKDAANIYENREGTKKIIRVVTVMAYVFSVSFAAILLSAYYVFLWEPPNPQNIQRHPLTSDPHPEYLTDKILPHSNPYAELKRQNVTEMQNFDLNSKLTSREGRVVKYRPELAARPQELLAFEDLPMNDAPVSEITEIEGNKVSVNRTVSDKPENKTSSLRLGNEGRKFILWENMKISSTKRYEDGFSSGIMNTETTPASPDVYGYSYPQTIGDTTQYNKVTTIEDYVTTGTSTTQQVSKLEDDFSSRKHEQRLPTEFEDEDTGTTTTTPDIPIYPEESARDIMKNRK